MQRPLVISIVLLLAGVAAAEDAPPAAPPSSPPPEPREEAPAVTPGDIPPVDALVVTPEYGSFRIRFYPEDAPNHVAHFLTLVAEGYFDGMSFHRVIPGLLIQTGDPASRDGAANDDGAGGPGYRLPAEPNERTHHLGTVSMAWRGTEPGTAGSQWFVSLGDDARLDEHATVIGEVVEGLDTVERIAQVSTYRDRRPVWRVAITEVRLVAAESPENGQVLSRSEDGG